MKIVSFTEARNGLKAFLDGVVNDADTTIITRRDSEDAVDLNLSLRSSIFRHGYLFRSREARREGRNAAPR